MLVHDGTTADAFQQQFQTDWNKSATGEVPSSLKGYSLGE